MNKKQRLHEDFEVSCRVLANLISKKEDPERLLLLQDFLTKARQIRPSISAQLALEIVTSFTPPDVRELMRDFKTEDMEPKPRADIAIVTIIPEELRGAKIAFGIDDERDEDRNENGLRFWEAKTQSNPSGEDLNVVITMVGKARNVECAVACSRVFKTYDVGLCVLLGIAAGLEKKVKLGDVVASELVLDYEGARLEPDGPKKRPTPYSLDKQLERDMNYFEPKVRGWHEDIKSRLELLKRMAEMPDIAEDWKPVYHRGVILSGEKLLADGSLPDMQASYHERVRAAEMEGSGFASICIEYAIPWLVFRGISDYGDPTKPDTSKWRTLSVLAAATAAHAFIRSDYRKKPIKF